MICLYYKTEHGNIEKLCYIIITIKRYESIKNTYYKKKYIELSESYIYKKDRKGYVKALKNYIYIYIINERRKDRKIIFITKEYNNIKNYNFYSYF